MIPLHIYVFSILDVEMSSNPNYDIYIYKGISSKHLNLTKSLIIYIALAVTFLTS
jgi:hypothetical protein